MFGYFSSSKIHNELSRSSCSGIRFPNKFWLSYEVSTVTIILQIRVIPEPAIYTFHLPGHWEGDIMMHKGASIQGAALAGARYSSAFSTGTTITIAPPGPGFDPISEPLNTNRSGLRTNSYTFRALRDRPDGKKTIERYEWISAMGGEARNMGEWVQGWKLRCITRGPAEDDEILAVFADTTVNVETAAKFFFINSAADGKMGEMWYLMVIMTFVRIWQQHMAKSWEALR